MDHITEKTKIQQKSQMQFEKIISSNKSTKIFDLGVHPYADTFIKKKDLHKSEPIFPLQCYLNLPTGFIFNKIITSSEERYNLFDYSYTSANSKYSREYWKSVYRNIRKKILKKNNKILEIGSNDGYLCRQFQRDGFKIYGVDASKEMSKIANKSGIKTFNLIFNKKNSEIIKKKTGNFDVVIANNVLNHSNDPFEFTNSVADLLNKGGYFIFEVPYWLNLVKKKQFDQIYHEHINYFTVKSVQNLLKKTKLFITNIENTEYHGGSLRFFCQKNSANNNILIKKFLKNEIKYKLFKSSTYIKIMNELKIRKYKFIKKILKIKLNKYKIVGIGAAAKANTMINFLKLDNDTIDCITDISPHKINKYTPLSRIPIVHDKILKKFKEKVYVLILSWNISNILIKKIKNLNKKLVFIKF
jgi:2-polyprenyl-3-methyl-5-hydroxy-6-metoxy-1,4-benzoquinol methylase